MKTLDLKNEKGTMTALLQIESTEIATARKEAYLDDTEHWPVPGIAPGLASIEDIEKTYGADALKEEALARALPNAYSLFLCSEKIRTVGKPEVLSVSLTKNGGALFTVRAAIYPKVLLGNYKGIAADIPRDHEEEFRMAVLREACREMKCEVPSAMTEARLDTMAANEKLLVCGDSVYHLLSDVTYLLRGAYDAAGVPRPAAQVNAEALDIMLRTVSSDNKERPTAFITEQLRINTKRYRTLPENFDELINKLIAKRAAQRKTMTQEEQTGEAFNAYLLSIGTDEKSWRKERLKEAEDAARCDLLLEAVADAENISADDREVDDLAAEIAKRSETSPQNVIEQIGRDTIRRQIMRDKACRFITDRAVSSAQKES